MLGKEEEEGEEYDDDDDKMEEENGKKGEQSGQGMDMGPDTGTLEVHMTRRRVGSYWLEMFLDQISDRLSISSCIVHCDEVLERAKGRSRRDDVRR